MAPGPPQPSGSILIWTWRFLRPTEGPPILALALSFQWMQITLGIFYTAYFARAVLIPITMAIILNFVLAPLTREITRRVRWPHPISAVLVVILFFGAIAFAFTLLSSPAADWMVKLPNEMSAIERKLRPLSGAVQNVQDAAQTVENMAQGQGPENPGERRKPLTPSLTS